MTLDPRIKKAKWYNIEGRVNRDRVRSKRGYLRAISVSDANKVFILRPVIRYRAETEDGVALTDLLTCEEALEALLQELEKD
jgi:hypothetical protein